MTDWNLRQARVEDADELAACLTAAYAPYRETIPGLPDVAHDCAGQITSCQSWVVEQEGEIVAALLLTPGEGQLYLTNVAVHPDHKRKGLGRMLITKAENEASTQGFPAVALTTHAMMPGNVRLYTHLGYVEEGRTVNKVFMRKEL